ncbi:DUF3048 domain-containing protein [Streptomyces sp. A7024]|uniref:DUF3048 domain-containing protein n=1 Tax=Streptomyces coryli TaxID=1128680 RepID=A0A6G4TU20_9ACTN|nr:DUF3048 domain-containing protein [Streptomyces coryli]NGN62956.1 DUF3048 domain-containing protein [Streptomyces coryli]
MSGIRRLHALAVAGVLLAVLIGCKPLDDEKSSGKSWLTGKPNGNGPVLAVKVDNVRAARPHTGLGSADIVYVEQVEAGLTRLLAVYASRIPDVVGPVRSARESDLELLRQFDRPALAYSGAQGKLLPLIHSAPLQEVTASSKAYYRGKDRPAPHNLFVRPERALDAADGASRAQDIGFRFGPTPKGGRAVTEERVRFPAAAYQFSWSADDRRWLVAMDGAPARTTDGGRVSAATVVIQKVKVRPSRFSDRGGNVTPYTETTGSGSAVVLRDGRAYDARWSRPSAGGGTTYTAKDGGRLRFAPGPVWVVLAPR